MSLQIVLTLSPDNELTAALRRRDGHEVPVKPPCSWRPLIERWAFGRTPSVRITARERDVLTGLVNGQSYKQIAYELELSIDTVRAYIKTLYRKLGVNCVAEAVSVALRTGLVD